MSTDPKFFNNQAYKDHEKVENGKVIGEFEFNTLQDGSQYLANKGFVLSFQHVPSVTSVYFKSFITAFNETYTSDWAAESVYGRADPIYLFKQTQRKITLAFKIPCSTDSEAYENLSKVQTLLQFLYPSYSDPASATTITQSPLIRLKVMNLLTDATTETTGDNAKDYYTSYKTTSDASKGLLGVINNLTVNHNLETPDIGVIEKGTSTLDAVLPKMIEINLDFSPIHETTLGWTDSATFSNQNFPYGARNADSSGPSKFALDPSDYGPFNKATGDARGKGGNVDRDQVGFGWTDSASVATGSINWPNLNQDEDEEEGYTTEQQIANADARYAGLFGNARLNKDLRRQLKGKTSEYVDSAIGGAYASGTGFRSAGDSLSDYDYVVSKRTETFYEEFGD